MSHPSALHWMHIKSVKNMSVSAVVSIYSCITSASSVAALALHGARLYFMCGEYYSLSFLRQSPRALKPIFHLLESKLLFRSRLSNSFTDFVVSSLFMDLLFKTATLSSFPVLSRCLPLCLPIFLIASFCNKRRRTTTTTYIQT